MKKLMATLYALWVSQKYLKNINTTKPPAKEGDGKALAFAAGYALGVSSK